jgi:DinB superfamily
MSGFWLFLRYQESRNAMPVKDSHDKQLREHLVDLLSGGGAHARFADVVSDMPENLRAKKPDGLPHSAWMLLEHMRIAQWDILEFSRNPKHESPKWPEGYWPGREAPPDAPAWNKSVQQFRKDSRAMQDLVTSPKTDLYAKIPWGDGQTILREALLIADHNAYHLGQLVDVRRLLGAWK